MPEALYILPKNTQRELASYALAAYPEECCGLLLRAFSSTPASTITTYAGIKNSLMAEKAGAHYSINPLELYDYEIKYADMGYDIIGFFHSHINKVPRPSNEDEHYMIPGMIYLIMTARAAGCPNWALWKKASFGEKASELPLSIGMENY